jgi:hypothetical protein
VCTCGALGEAFKKNRGNELLKGKGKGKGKGKQKGNSLNIGTTASWLLRN